jgi:hypothetical protein
MFDPAVTDSMMDRLSDIRDYADQQNLLVEVYIGYPLGADSAALDDEYKAILEKTDRLAVHAYATTPDAPGGGGAYQVLNYRHPHDSTPEQASLHRMMKVRAAEMQLWTENPDRKPTVIWPIFSAESAPPDPDGFMGPYFQMHTAGDAEAAMNTRFGTEKNSVPAGWEDGVLVLGKTRSLTLDGYLYFKSTRILLP